MQSQQNNLCMLTPVSDVSNIGPMDDDIELFTSQDITLMSYPSPFNYNNNNNNNNESNNNVSQFITSNPNNYFNQQEIELQLQLQQQSYLPLVAPLVSPPTLELTEAIERMNMGDQYGHRQRLSLSSNLSLEIQPSISITEPTPIHRMSNLNHIDGFIDHHFSELSRQEQEQLQQQQQQQQKQQQQQQQHDSLIDYMDHSFMDDLLIAETGQCDWLSWTPAGGSSPVSISLDDQNSIYSTSPEPSYILNMMSTINTNEMLPVLGSSYPSPSFSEYNNTLSVKKPNRSRRVSEPPKPSNSIFQQFNNDNILSSDNNTLLSDSNNNSRPIRRSSSDRRSRSNSNVSPSTVNVGNHPCNYPGCGKSFTRPYNLTSHMRTHTSDRPFACSQCGRKFARQHDRNRHEKLHWGIKPYACSHCKKPFARMDALNRHLRVENGCSSSSNSHSYSQL